MLLHGTRSERPAERPWILFPTLLAILGAPAVATAQDESPQVWSLELSITPRVLVVGGEQRRVACAARVSQETIRVQVVDLDERSVVASREFPLQKIRFAGGAQALYAVMLDRDRLDVLSWDDLTTARSVELSSVLSPDVTTAQVGGASSLLEDPQVVGGQFLGDTQRTFRLDLPILRPTQRWQAETGRVERVPGGWFVDGVIYDERLSEPRLIAREKPTGKPWKLPSARLYGSKSAIFGSMRFGAASQDFPIVALAIAPGREDPEVELPVSVQILDRRGTELAKREVDRFPTGFDYSAYTRYQSGDWLTSVIDRRLGVTMTFIGNRLLIGCNEKLHVWELAPSLLEAAGTTLTIMPRQSQFVLPWDEAIDLKHKIVGGKPPYKLSVLRRTVDGDDFITVSGREAVERMKSRFTTLSNWLKTKRPVAEESTRSGLYERLFQKPPPGPYLPWPVEARVVDAERASVALTYYVLLEYPESLAEAEKKRDEEERQRAAAVAEIRARHEQQLAAKSGAPDSGEVASASNFSDRERKLMRESREEIAGTIRERNRMWAGQVGLALGVMAGGFAAAAVCMLAIAVATKPSPRPGAFGRGRIIMVSCIVLFLVAQAFVGLVELDATTTGIALVASLTWLLSMVVGGLFLTWRDRGYSSVVSLMFAIVLPVGLVALFILPDRRAPLVGAVESR